MKKIFNNRTLSKKIDAATYGANLLLINDSPMMVELGLKNDFQYDSGTGEEVVKKILAFNKTTQVFTYRPWNRFTSALGYSSNGEIHINIRKLDSIEFNDLVGLLCHEYLHCVGFHHGNNYKTNHKCLYSVPYFVSENISKWH